MVKFYRKFGNWDDDQFTNQGKFFSEASDIFNNMSTSTEFEGIPYSSCV